MQFGVVAIRKANRSLLAGWERIAAVVVAECLKRRDLLFFFLLLLYVGARFFHVPVYEAEMLQAIGREMKLEEPESRELTGIHTAVSRDGGKLLLICQLGERYAPRYFARTFKLVGENAYTLEKSTIISDTDIPDISHMTWDGRYLVVVNNPQVDTYTAIIDGREEVGTIEGIPETLEFVGAQDRSAFL